MKKVKCGECKNWDRENIKKISTQGGTEYDDIASCLSEDGEGWFEYRNRCIDCGSFVKVEPEVYEVECTWERSDAHSIIFPVADKVCLWPKGFAKFVGKRTKLTIEVLP
jgi:hypothetical protein